MRDKFIRIATIVGLLLIPTSLLYLVDRFAGPRDFRPFSVAGDDGCGPSHDIENRPGICARILWPAEVEMSAKERDLVQNLKAGFRGKGLRAIVVEEERPGLATYQVQFTVGATDVGTFGGRDLARGLEMVTRRYWMDPNTRETIAR